MHLKVKRQSLISIFILAIVFNGNSQEIRLKSNLLYDATTSINAGMEFGLNEQWSLDISGSYNPWSFSGKKWQHWFIQPEARYWLHNKYEGHFIGAHLIGGAYNAGGIHFPMNILGSNIEKDYRYEGWFIGSGVVYGYAWKLSPRWNIEAGLGVGYIGADYNKYECVECGGWISDGFNSYLGLTKLSVSIIYIIK